MEKKQIPLLFGLPIAIKDHLPVKGFMVTNGLAQNLSRICTEDCEIVRVFRELGAIFYILTNTG